jgi:hypothetical protein
MPDLTVTQIIQFSGMLLQAGVAFYQRKAINEGKTIDEVLAEAEATWKQSLTEAEELLNQGHE